MLSIANQKESFFCPSHNGTFYDTLFFTSNIAPQLRPVFDKRCLKMRGSCRERPKAFINSQELDAIGASAAIGRGSNAWHLQNRSGERSTSGPQIISQSSAKKTVARANSEFRLAEPVQGKLAQASAHTIADGQCAHQHGGGNNDAQKRAGMAARIEAQAVTDELTGQIHSTHLKMRCAS